MKQIINEAADKRYSEMESDELLMSTLKALSKLHKAMSQHLGGDSRQAKTVHKAYEVLFTVSSIATEKKKMAAAEKEKQKERQQGFKTALGEELTVNVDDDKTVEKATKLSQKNKDVDIQLVAENALTVGKLKSLLKEAQEQKQEKHSPLFEALLTESEKLQSKKKLNEFVDVETYFETYSGALEFAEKDAEKRGFDPFRQYENVPHRPRDGETVRINSALRINGEETGDYLHIQVYNMGLDRGRTFELTHYFSYDKSQRRLYKQAQRKKSLNEDVQFKRTAFRDGKRKMTKVITMSNGELFRTHKTTNIDSLIDKWNKQHSKPDDSGFTYEFELLKKDDNDTNFSLLGLTALQFDKLIDLLESDITMYDADDMNYYEDVTGIDVGRLMELYSAYANKKTQILDLQNRYLKANKYPTYKDFKIAVQKEEDN